MNKLLLSVMMIFVNLNLSTQHKPHREIWLFTHNTGNASFINQKAALADVAGLNDRDILVHEVVGVKANQALFKKYKAENQEFTFILIGKDGGEKLRSNKPISKEKLYRTIDAMPMRQSEMNDRP